MVTPVMANRRGCTVNKKVVLADKPPESVAVRVTENGEPTVVDGVPVMVFGETKLTPAGNPNTESVRLLGVSGSVKVVAGIV